MNDELKCPFCGGEFAEITSVPRHFAPTFYCEHCDYTILKKDARNRSLEAALQQRIEELGIMWQIEHTDKVAAEERLKMANGMIDEVYKKRIEEMERQLNYAVNRLKAYRE